MSATRPMTPLRRRPMPGMPAAPPAAPDPTPTPEPKPSTYASAAAPTTATAKRASRIGSARSRRETQPSPRRSSTDYSSTRLANFRLPVDLHDRYRELVHQAQLQHPRLRRLSLTEVLVALMEEGPQTPVEVAELVRRKRAYEHSEEAI
jgi:hypothetical protein